MKRLIILFSIFLITILNIQLAAQSEETAFYSSYIIKSSEIQITNYRFCGDLLYHIPGLWTRDIGSMGQWTTSRHWGCERNQSTFLLDGSPIIDPWTGLSDLTIFPMEMIEYIQFYPTLNPFGINSTGGIINFSTRNLESNRPYSKVVYRTAQDNFSDLDVSFGQKILSGLEIYSGALLKKYGEELPDQKFSTQKIRSKIICRPFSGLTLQYTVLHNQSDLDIPYTFPLPGDTLQLESPHRKRTRYDHLFKTTWDFRGITNYLYLDHTILKHEIREQDFSLKEIYPVQTTMVSLGQNYNIGNNSLHWLMQTRHRQVDSPEGNRYQDDITNGRIYGTLNLATEFQFTPQLNVFRSSDNKTRLILATQLAWIPSEKFKSWASYSEGLREPSLGEKFGFLFYPDLPVTLNEWNMRNLHQPLSPNTSLKPEKTRTIELGLQWKYSDRLNFLFRGYFRKSEDMIQGRIDTTATSYYINQTSLKFQGLEAQLKIKPFNGFRAKFHMNFQDAADMGNTTLFERPQLTGLAQFIGYHNFLQNDLIVNVSFSCRFWTGFWNLIIETPTQATSQSIQPGIIFNFQVSLTVLQNANISFAFDNLFQDKTTFISNFHGPKQQFRIGIAWQLFD